MQAPASDGRVAGFAGAIAEAARRVLRLGQVIQCRLGHPADRLILGHAVRFADGHGGDGMSVQIAGAIKAAVGSLLAPKISESEIHRAGIGVVGIADRRLVRLPSREKRQQRQARGRDVVADGRLGQDPSAVVFLLPHQPLKTLGDGGFGGGVAAALGDEFLPRRSTAAGEGHARQDLAAEPAALGSEHGRDPRTLAQRTTALPSAKPRRRRHRLHRRVRGAGYSDRIVRLQRPRNGLRLDPIDVVIRLQVRIQPDVGVLEIVLVGRSVHSGFKHGLLPRRRVHGYRPKVRGENQRQQQRHVNAAAGKPGGNLPLPDALGRVVAGAGHLAQRNERRGHRNR